MIEFVVRFWRWLLRLILGERPALAFELVDDEPGVLKAGVLYVVGDPKQPWKAMLVCPCGCAETIELNLSPPGHPLWTIVETNGNRATLHPSVWRTTGCRSHFWVRKGEIQWCEAHSRTS